MIEEPGFTEEAAQGFAEAIEGRKAAEDASEGRKEDLFIGAFNEACERSANPSAFLSESLQDDAHDSKEGRHDDE